jgi:NADH-quinone oxidoreductase subunit D
MGLGRLGLRSSREDQPYQGVQEKESAGMRRTPNASRVPGAQGIFDDLKMANVEEIQFKDPPGRTAEATATLADELEDVHGEPMVLNMGPSHPATHGVLRVVLELDGEIITKAAPEIGYLHRGDEKIAENMTYTQFIPYTDRLDYLAPLANNVAYALAVEKLLGIDKSLPVRCQFIRVICCELARISSHQ